MKRRAGLLTLCAFGAALVVLQSAAVAAPGEGIRLPGLTLRPSFEGAITRDSNVWLANEDDPARLAAGGPGVEDDIFYTAGLQLSAVIRSDDVRMTVDGWGRMQRYQDISERDLDEFGERVQLGFGSRRNLSVNLYQRFASVDQYDRGPVGRDLDPTSLYTGLALTDPTLQDRASLIKNKTVEFGADFGRDLTDKMTADLRYAVSSTKYNADDSPGILAQDVSATPLQANDSIIQRLGAELGWRATDKTTFLLTGEGSIQDSDAFDSPATLLALRLGVASRTLEKLQFRAGAGVMKYEYDTFPGLVGAAPEGERGSAASESDVGLSYELGTSWTPTDRWRLQASAFSGYQPAIQYSGNAVYDNALLLSAAYRITPGLHLSVGGGLRREEYLEPVRLPDPAVAGGFSEMDKTVDLATLFARLDYLPADSIYGAYVDVQNTRSTSDDLYAEYEVTRVSAGVNLRY